MFILSIWEVGPRRIKQFKKMVAHRIFCRSSRNFHHDVGIKYVRGKENLRKYEECGGWIKKMKKEFSIQGWA